MPSVSSRSNPITIDGAGPLLRRVRAWERKKIAMTAGGAFALLIGAVVLAATSKHGNKDAGRSVAIASPPPALVSPPVITPPAPPPAPIDTTLTSTKPGVDPGGEKTGTDEADDGDSSDDSDSKTAERPEPETTPRPSGAGRSARASAADNRKQLEEAERLLRAERFTEARGISSRVWPSRGATAGRRWSVWPRSRSRKSTTKRR